MVEFATDKQKWLMNKEGIQFFQNTTKQEAKELIEQKLGKNDNYKPKTINFPTSQKVGGDDKNKTFYIAYAKDVFITLVEAGSIDPENNVQAEQVMTTAIDLIKQAKTAFENDY